MYTRAMPERGVMVQPMQQSDRSVNGLFWVAVRTTGYFCRPTCSARKALEQDVKFYGTAEEAMAEGYRACVCCRPLDALGTAPDWLKPFLAAVESKSGKRWTDEEVQVTGVDPLRVRRWFNEIYGVTFHTHLRARRVASALNSGGEQGSLDDAAAEAGYASLSGFRDVVQRELRTTPGKGRAARMLIYARVLTPLGPMLAMAEEGGLVMLEFLDRPALPLEVTELRERYGYTVAPGRNGHIDCAERELAAYFAGDLWEFTVPLVTPGTAFQVKVWEALRRIPHGTTASYGEQARRLGVPGAVRAVGRANGQNRISIVLPCHRVIGADGSLTRYGGGKLRKAFLLEHERRREGNGGQPSLFGEGG